MAWVYILKGSSGRHYIGSAVDLKARFAQHRRGHTHTTKRLGENLQIVVSKEVVTLREARSIERMLKAKKNPELAIHIYNTRAAPKAFGVGQEFDSPPWQFAAYILRGSSRPHYIGSPVDLDARFEQHLRHTASTKRLGNRLEIVAKNEVPTLGGACETEY